MLELYGYYKYIKRHTGIFYYEDEMTRSIDNLGHHLNSLVESILSWSSPSLIIPIIIYFLV
ncbi:hypothetical protein GW17_00029797 [Ensete ventricosum]|nr:hypothetical protein GW17_00029797 [Ensete ventricosum]